MTPSTESSRPKLAFTPGQVELVGGVGVEPELGGDALPVDRGEVHGHLADLADDVEVGGQGGDGAVEEHQVLDEEHQLLGHLGADAEQGLGGLLDLVHQLVGRERGGVDDRAIEPEVDDHRVEVGVGGQRAEVAQRRELAGDVVGRAAHEEPQEGVATGLAQPPDDAEVEQRRPTVGQDEEVPAVQVAVEDPVDHRALHEPDHPRAHHRLGVDAGVLHAGHVVELEALEALHHQHPWRRPARGEAAGPRSPPGPARRRCGPRRACSVPRAGSRAPR